MAQWSKQPGARLRWHSVTNIEVRAEQPNPNLVYAACGQRFPEIGTVDVVPDDEAYAQCPRCLGKVGG